MGRYKAEAVIMRDMERLTIIFKDEETIWVIPKDDPRHVIFHRWFQSRWHEYGQWASFSYALRLSRALNIWQCLTLADKYNIATHTTKRLPSTDGRPLKLKFERRRPWERSSQNATRTG